MFQSLNKIKRQNIKKKSVCQPWLTYFSLDSTLGNEFFAEQCDIESPHSRPQGMCLNYLPKSKLSAEGNVVLPCFLLVCSWVSADSFHSTDPRTYLWRMASRMRYRLCAPMAIWCESANKSILASCAAQHKRSPAIQRPQAPTVVQQVPSRHPNTVTLKTQPRPHLRPHLQDGFMCHLCNHNYFVFIDHYFLL